MSLLKVVTDPQTSEMYYSVARHLSFGCTGDDVALVQYLLARAPDAKGLQTTDNVHLLNDDSPIAVADVDGIWGPQTDSAMAWFEQACDLPVFRDGAIDPLGSVSGSDDEIFYHGETMYYFKLVLLQQLYVAAATLYPGISTENRNWAMRRMAVDGQCPSILAKNPVLAAQAMI